MAGHLSSIDDLLLNSTKPQDVSQSTQLPDSPEQTKHNEQTENEQNESPTQDVSNNHPNENDQTDDAESRDIQNREKDSEKTDAAPKESATDENFDEYGNEKPKKSDRTYTEDEVNERINRAVRERLERLERNQGQQHSQPSQQQVKQAQDAGFEYDANSEANWQDQLKQFIRQTNEEIQREQYTKQQQAKEQKIQQEFEEKLQNGMTKFQDFRDVVGQQPITDAMALATRQMKDPASFLYAASRRHADDLQRISQIPDAYGQMVEIGRLEERMKKQQSGTKAPRPVSRSKEDTTVNEPEYRKPTVDDLIAEANQKKLSRYRGVF